MGTTEAHADSDSARERGLKLQRERRRLKRMHRQASLKRTPSHVEERKIMKALERVPADQSGSHPVNSSAPPEVPAGETVGELEREDVSDKGSESSKVAGMSLKDRRALWESTLPQKSSVLPVRPRSDHELGKLVGHIWIDTDETPTVPYSEAGKKTDKPAKSNTVKLPW